MAPGASIENIINPLSKLFKKKKKKRRKPKKKVVGKKKVVKRKKKKASPKRRIVKKKKVVKKKAKGKKKPVKKKAVKKKKSIKKGSAKQKAQSKEKTVSALTQKCPINFRSITIKATKDRQLLQTIPGTEGILLEGVPCIGVMRQKHALRIKTHIFGQTLFHNMRTYTIQLGVTLKTSCFRLLMIPTKKRVCFRDRY